MANHELMKLTSHQVLEGKYNKAILAVGSCEAHGPHLASGTDTLVSYMLSCWCCPPSRLATVPIMTPSPSP